MVYAGGARRPHGAYFDARFAGPGSPAGLLVGPRVYVQAHAAPQAALRPARAPAGAARHAGRHPHRRGAPAERSTMQPPAVPVQRSPGSLWWPRWWRCLWHMVSGPHARAAVPNGACMAPYRSYPPACLHAGIGANDLANSFGTSVGADALSSEWLQQSCSLLLLLHMPAQAGWLLPMQSPLRQCTCAPACCPSAAHSCSQCAAVLYQPWRLQCAKRSPSPRCASLAAPCSWAAA